MNKAKEILYKHAKNNGCKWVLSRNPFLKQAVLNAINEALTIHSVSHCTCTPDETTGTTTVKCCNICGKPAESFGSCGYRSEVELCECNYPLVRTGTKERPEYCGNCGKYI